MRITRDSLDRFFDYDLHVETRTIFISDTADNMVGPNLAERVIKALHLLTAMDKEKEIRIILNSKGGDWYDGIAIFDCISACPCHVTIEVFGAAMSMGSIILQAADLRIIHPNATVMIHDGSDCFDGAARDFERWGEQSKIVRRRMYEIYAKASGKDAKYWERRCSHDTILNAEQAVAEGLADKIAGQEEEEDPS